MGERLDSIEVNLDFDEKVDVQRADYYNPKRSISHSLNNKRDSNMLVDDRSVSNRSKSKPEPEQSSQ